MTRTLAWLAALMATGAFAQDCSLLPGDQEKIACQDARYQHADEALNKAYSKLHLRLGDNGRKALEEDQARWSEARNAYCRTYTESLRMAEARCKAEQGLARAEVLKKQWTRCASEGCEAGMAATEVPATIPAEPALATATEYVTDPLPTGKVRATYYNDKALVGTEQVDAISMNYAYAEFRGIPSQRFHAVWEQDIVADHDGQAQVLAVSVSWSDVEVSLDGKSVARWSNDSREVPLVLSRGRHRLKVEYYNHWHTVTFNASFSNEVKLRMDDALVQIQPLLGGDTRMIYIGAYESASRSNEVIVRVPRIPSGVILFLSSYEAIRWRVDSPAARNVRGVFINSYDPGSSVAGLDPKTRVYHLVDLPRPYEKFGEAVTYVRKLTGKSPAYTYGEYGLTVANVPQL